MKYFIVAGERSGDLHGSKLARQIKRHDIRADIKGFGGSYMETEDVEILKHYSSFSFMGVVEVISNLGKVRRTLREAKEAILTTEPDVLILIDFPGINLKLASYAKKHGIKTCYYISPKIWAWKEHRIKRIKRDIDKMLVILPFEVEYYQKKDFEVTYVGNPLIDAIKDYDYDSSFQLDENVVNIAILPGSRKQEINASQEVVAKIAAKAPSYQFHIAAVNNVDSSLYDVYSNIENATIHMDRTYEVLKYCNAAIVTSGTATLETALLNCPQVVVYKANAISVFIVKLMIKIKWISLVNLIANKAIVKELIQNEYNETLVLNEIDKILNDQNYCAGMMADYQDLRDKIGAERASGKAANIIVEWLESGSS